MLGAIGAASIVSLIGGPVLALPAEPRRGRRVVVARPGENRFPYASAQQAERSPCKLTSADSGSALSMFELNVASHAGPVRHIHHREDEWCYVLAGEFQFEAGEEKTTLPVGGSIWMPRGIPHVWANVSSSAGKLLVACQPGGFEKFFDALGKIPETEVGEAATKRVMARFGMDVVGPPLFGLWRQQK
jgi:quercetin dioxygenase-like cupin family protein